MRIVATLKLNVRFVDVNQLLVSVTNPRLKPIRNERLHQSCLRNSYLNTALPTEILPDFLEMLPRGRGV